jgi:transposase
MRVTSLLNKLLHLPGLWVRGIEFVGNTLFVDIQRRFRLLTCPECGTRVRGRFEETERQWRHLGLGGFRVFLRGAVRRLRCPHCQAVRTERVPWARAGSVFTRPFEDAVGLLAQKLDHTAVAEFIGIAWITVGRIAARLVNEKLHVDRFENLRRIGVDEISYRKRHKYITVVVDHDTGRVIWVGEGKSSKALGAFFEELGPERAASIELVSIDMSAAFIKAIQEAVPHAQIVFDRFHVARLAQEAVTEVRRAEMRKLAEDDKAWLKGTRWVLLKRPANRTPKDEARLAVIQKTNAPVYRAVLLKESFLEIFNQSDPEQAERDVKAWLRWAARCRLKPFVRLARTVRKYLTGILAFISSRLTNARLEGTNNKIRLLSHRSYGLHSAASLIAMVYLCCANITLPQLQLI